MPLSFVISNQHISYTCKQLHGIKTFCIKILYSSRSYLIIILRFSHFIYGLTGPSKMLVIYLTLGQLQLYYYILIMFYSCYDNVTVSSRFYVMWWWHLWHCSSCDLWMVHRVSKDSQSSQSDQTTDDSSERTVPPSSDDESSDKPRRKRRKVGFFHKIQEIWY